ncbi:hypothetical protein B5M09_010513, partial [Aphanomyces astaci]
AEALAHHARFQFDRPIKDIRETEWEAMFEASMLIPTSSKAVVVPPQTAVDGQHPPSHERPHDGLAGEALMHGIKPDGAKALVRNSYDFDDKEIKFNISKFWSHVRGVLSNVLPAMAAEADALPPRALATRNVPQQSQLRQQCWPPRSNDSKTTTH